MAPSSSSKNGFPYSSAYSASFPEQFMDNFRSSHFGVGVDHTSGSGTDTYTTFWPQFPFCRPPHHPHHGPPNHGHPRPPSPPTPPGFGHHAPLPRPPPPPPPPGGHHRPHPHVGAWAWSGPGNGGGWFMNSEDFDFYDNHYRHDHGHGYGHGHGHGRHGRHNSGSRHLRGDRVDDGAGIGGNKVSVTIDDGKCEDITEEIIRTSEDQKRDSTDKSKQEDVPDPEEMVPEDEEASNSGHTHAGGGFGYGGPSHYWQGPGVGSFGGFSHRSRPFHGGFDPYSAGSHCGFSPNDFTFPNITWFFMDHPFFQHMSEAARNCNNNGENNTEDSDKNNSFTPPVDIFNTPSAYVLHVALPGVIRENVNVNWDPRYSTLSITGIILRPGDEEFLKTLYSTERRIGVFERKIVLPPQDMETQQQQQSQEEIDSDGIAAKLDDGVLVIMVPKMEKEWTQVRKVDIL